MGLDMYFKAKRFIWSEERKDLVIKGIELPELEVSNIEFSIGYLRKANAIHWWIVKNCANGVDECQEIPLDKAKINELISVITKVLRYPKSAKRLLPTKEGFFFGSLEYDKYYFDDLRDTKIILQKALEMSDKCDIVYKASW